MSEGAKDRTMAKILPIPTKSRYEIVFWRNDDDGEAFGSCVADNGRDAAAFWIASMREEHGVARFAAAMTVVPARRQSGLDACHFTALIERGEIIAWWDMDGELQAGDESESDVLFLNGLLIGANPRDAVEHFNEIHPHDLDETKSEPTQLAQVPLPFYGLMIDPSDDEDNVPADALGIVVFTPDDPAIAPTGSVSVITTSDKQVDMQFASGAPIFVSVRRVLASGFPAGAHVAALLLIEGKSDGVLQLSPSAAGDSPGIFVSADVDNAASELAEDDEVAREYMDSKPKRSTQYQCYKCKVLMPNKHAWLRHNWCRSPEPKSPGF